MIYNLKSYRFLAYLISFHEYLFSIIKNNPLLKDGKSNVLYKLLSYRGQPVIFFLLFITCYIITPLFDYYFLNPNKYMFLLAEISAVAAVGLLFGYFLLAQFCQIKPVHLISIRGIHFVWFVFIFFLILLVLIIVTADSIPLFLALKTRDPYELSVARANFLKARTGIEQLFVYANAVLTTSFLPYVILLSFFRSYALRWYFLAVPYLYSFLTLEKVFFLKFILPFISYCSSLINRPNYKKYVIIGVFSIPLVIYLNTVISGFGSQTSSETIEPPLYNAKSFSEFSRSAGPWQSHKTWDVLQLLQPSISWELLHFWQFKKFQQDQKYDLIRQFHQFRPYWQPWQHMESQEHWDSSQFFGSWQSWQLKQLQLLWATPKAECKSDSFFYSASYIGCASNGRIQFLTWRLMAVPVFTASDSLKLFEEKYKGHLFWGRTSTLLSALFGVQNVKFERETFSSEWGQDTTGTASANSVFIIEQYINFGWFGVILSSILVGYMFAVLRRSKDLALASMSIALSISLIVGGLISTMLSGGFLALFIFLFFVKLDD